MCLIRQRQLLPWLRWSMLIHGVLDALAAVVLIINPSIVDQEAGVLELHRPTPVP